MRQNFNRRKVQILNSVEKQGKILIRDDYSHLENMQRLFQMNNEGKQMSGEREQKRFRGLLEQLAQKNR